MSEPQVSPSRFRSYRWPIVERLIAPPRQILVRLCWIAGPAMALVAGDGSGLFIRGPLLWLNYSSWAPQVPWMVIGCGFAIAFALLSNHLTTLAAIVFGWLAIAVWCLAGLFYASMGA